MASAFAHALLMLITVLVQAARRRDASNCSARTSN